MKPHCPKCDSRGTAGEYWLPEHHPLCRVRWNAEADKAYAAIIAAAEAAKIPDPADISPSREDRIVHYRNGREAKNGDKIIVVPSYGAPFIGILYDARLATITATARSR